MREAASSSASTNDAQKKFGNAKAISSDQFFQDSGSADVSLNSSSLLRMIDLFHGILLQIFTV